MDLDPGGLKTCGSGSGTLGTSNAFQLLMMPPPPTPKPTGREVGKDYYLIDAVICLLSFNVTISKAGKKRQSGSEHKRLEPEKR